MTTNPPFHITKEHFVGVINSLHQQYLKDKACSEAFGSMFSAPDCGFYDNSHLINAIFSFLHMAFPKDDDGHCEIQHWCYVLQFGKVGEDYESPEELYNRLMLAKGIMWFDTPDKGMLYANISELMPQDKLFFGSKAQSYPIEDEAVQFPGHKVAGGKESAFLMDEASTLPSNEQLETNKKYWDNVAFKNHYLKPSPDETH